MALPEPRNVAAGPGTISYRERGSGPVLLFVHGLGGGSRAWETQFATLSHRYRVIGWDAPGYGDSTPFDAETPRVADYVETIARFLDALEVDRVHFVGHSLGTIHGCAFHKRFADRLSSLTLAQAVVGSGRMGADDKLARNAGREELVNRLGPKGFAEHHTPRSLSANAAPELVLRATEFATSLNVPGYLQAFRALTEAHIFDEITALTVPAMIVAGSDDGTASEETMATIAAAMPGIRAEVIQDIGHMIYLEHPDRFNALLADFLAI